MFGDTNFIFLNHFHSKKYCFKVTVLQFRAIRQNTESQVLLLSNATRGRHPEVSIYFRERVYC